MENLGKRTLAIDYGARRVGIAVTDPLQMFAIALETVNNDKKFWLNLLKIIASYDVETIVLGYPLKESGERSSSTELVEKFHEKLIKKISIPVIYIDERYSSSIAKQQILETVTSRKKRRDKGLVDKNAAAVILQDYLSGAY